jgi:hypothetical protein
MKIGGNIAAAMLVVLLAAPTLAACSSGGAKTSCDLSSCTITFPRNGDTKVSVLGFEVAYVGTSGEQSPSSDKSPSSEKVTLKVAGQEVSAPIGQPIQVAGLNVTVESVTDSEVVVKVTR